MGIKMVEDLGAPGAVALMNVVTKEAAPDWNEWGHYIMTGIGYGAAFMGFGGVFLKNIGLASLSGTVGHIYNRVKATTPLTRAPASRMAYRSASPGGSVRGPVQRSYQPEFEAVAPYAF